MKSFNGVTMTSLDGTVVIAQRLSGEVDSFENPNHGSLNGVPENGVPYESYIGENVLLKGAEGVSFRKAIIMKLDSVIRPNQALDLYAFNLASSAHHGGQ